MGAFYDKSKAEKLYAELAKKGYSAYMQDTPHKGNPLYRVRVGAFKSRTAATRFSTVFKKVEKLDIYVVAEQAANTTASTE